MIQYMAAINSLYDFSFWGGARNQFNFIVEEGGIEAVDYLEELLSDFEETLTETDINDFIWFEAYDLLVEEGFIEEEEE